ncbi:MAG: transcription initiation factor IIB [Nitrosopumilaceae archaeon]|nr:transcription initiation factor IIB [Nitrosopumilaceae archaeon]NIU87541.1 transcription initiation factor IIB [Nitrosopumilaceae archaeon]NIV66006.1 transcription initiation factor IIB [Nitrosopumilaceae archaeon]
MVLQQFLEHKCVEQAVDENPLITDEIRGEILCGNCGLVLADKIADTQNDRRSFTKEQYMNRTRTGSPAKMSIYDMGLSATISQTNRDASGHELSNKQKMRFSRLRTWDNRSKRKTRDRNFVKAFSLLDSLKTHLGLSDYLSEKTAYIYRKAVEKNLIRGRSIPEMLASSLYAACRETDTPRSLDEIASSANITRKALSRSYRQLVKKIKLNLEPTNSIDYVSKIANRVNASEKSKRITWKILYDAKKSGATVGKNPVGLAGAALYLACAGNGEDITYGKLSKISDTSTVTLRKRTKQLRNIASRYIDTIECIV